jgi:hypothetical protein
LVEAFAKLAPQHIFQMDKIRTWIAYFTKIACYAIGETVCTTIKLSFYHKITRKTRFLAENFAPDAGPTPRKKPLPFA